MYVTIWSKHVHGIFSILHEKHSFFLLFCKVTQQIDHYIWFVGGGQGWKVSKGSPACSCSTAYYKSGVSWTATHWTNLHRSKWREVAADIVCIRGSTCSSTSSPADGGATTLRGFRQTASSASTWRPWRALLTSSKASGHIFSVLNTQQKHGRKQQREDLIRRN